MYVALFLAGPLVVAAAVGGLWLVSRRRPRRAESAGEGTVFSAMREKNPELYASLEMLPPGEAMDRWVEKYPDDFPERGATWVGDTSAIKPTAAKE